MKGESLPQHVLTQLRQSVRPGETVCCALSGGADSVCLLRCLLELRQTLSITVTAVHVNHQLRGAESDRDQRFCETLCQKYGVVLHGYTVDVAAYAAREQISIELAARQCRYAAFAQVQADWIATAHTASDNLETLIHRLTRGASLHGLTAIPPVNGRFLRPMLYVTREVVEAYLKQLEQSYMTDSTNLTDAYTRNRIRHQIVPVLRQLNPSVERTVSYTIRSLRREDDYLAQQTEEAYWQCRQGEHTLGGLEQLHPALRFRCLARLLEEHALPYDAPLLERLEQLIQSGGRWNLSGNVYALAKPGMITIETLPERPQEPKPVPLKIGENRLYSGFVFTAKLADGERWRKDRIVHEKFANYCLDYDKIKGNLFLCPRPYGARIQLCGRTFTSSLKKCIQASVPRERRSTLHTLMDDEGVVFAEYIGIAQRVRPDAATKRLLVLEVTAEQIKPVEETKYE